MYKRLIFLACLFSRLLFASDDISLVKASSYLQDIYHGIHWQHIEIVVKAKKKFKYVTIRNVDGALKSTANSEAIDQNYNLWKFSSKINVYRDGDQIDLNFEIVARDNELNEVINDNMGERFVLNAGEGSILSKDINVMFRPDGQVNEVKRAYGLVGGIDLRNLSYVKDVKVHYTFDHWKTKRLVAARYQSTNQYDFESWEFYIGPQEFEDAENKSLEFAISYTVDGRTYWDNNFGKNYRYRVIY